MDFKLMSWKHAFLLRNTQIGSDIKIAEPITENIPEILKIYLGYAYDDKGIYSKNNLSGNGYTVAHVEMKSNAYRCMTDDDDFMVKNDDGYLKEYKSYKPRSNVNLVDISDENTCGNYIIGSLIKKAYPSVKIIILDRYRGYDSHILCAKDLDLDYLITESSQGYDDPFTYIRNLPLLKGAIFTSIDCYGEKYPVDKNCMIYRSFTDNFEDCLTITKNLELVLFFVRSDASNLIPFQAPRSWTHRILKFSGPQEYYWIVYEKNL